MTILFVTVAIFWLLVAWLMDRCVRAVTPLPRRARRSGASVTIVLTARDEVERIGESARRWLDQRDVDLRLVVVDDRSTDGTAEALPEDPRLELVRVEALPDGWLGKTHACHVGADRARSEWLIFTDADAWAEPELVADALAAANEGEASHFSILPGQQARGLIGRAVLAHFLTLGTTGAGLVNGGSRRAACGAGAFNMIRRDAYEAFGGHRSLQLEVLDDLGLAARARDAGLRSLVHDAAERLDVDWASGATGLIRATEKNFFALTGYRWSVASAICLFGAAVWTPAVVGPLFGPFGIAATLALALTVVPHLRVAIRRDLGVLAAFLAPLTSPVVWIALLNSAWATTRRGGVVWRERLYPTELLRGARKR